MESPTPDKKKKRWVHILLWSLADLLLVIPVLIVLWFFGQMIDKKNKIVSPNKLDIYPILTDNYTSYLQQRMSCQKKNARLMKLDSI